jgi:uncharacterized protein
MLWQGRRTSSNVEDRRGMSGGKIAIGGGIGTIVIGLIIFLLGGNPGEILNQLQTGVEEQSYIPSEKEDELAQFVSVVLADCEDVWTKVFEESGKIYRKPTLVLYTSQVNSACGMAGSASGPFYCQEDEKIYIDLSFMDELQNRFNAPGDFAMAYVIAHEVGHHVQKLLGILEQVHELRGSVSEQEYNDYSVRLELQADFLSGVWAFHAQEMFGILEEGDIQEALDAANAVGDDRIQMETQGQVVPDSFTHGTSAQRVKWFKKGFKTGDIAQGDTFGEEQL